MEYINCIELLVLRIIQLDGEKKEQLVEIMAIAYKLYDCLGLPAAATNL